MSERDAVRAYVRGKMGFEHAIGVGGREDGE